MCSLLVSSISMWFKQKFVGKRLQTAYYSLLLRLFELLFSSYRSVGQLEPAAEGKKKHHLRCFLFNLQTDCKASFISENYWIFSTSPRLEKDRKPLVCTIYFLRKGRTETFWFVEASLTRSCLELLVGPDRRVDLRRVFKKSASPFRCSRFH